MPSRRFLNTVGNLGRFLMSWSTEGHFDNQSRVALQRTSHGNINSTGRIGVYEAPALSRWHPQFCLALEEGISEMVILFVDRFSWTTYTSCSGHLYEDGTPAVERYVGLIPDSAEQHKVMVSVLTELTGVVSPAAGPVKIEVLDTTVTGVVDGLTLPAVHLIFRKASESSWRAYFEGVEALYRDALLWLDKRGDLPVHS